MIEAAQQQLDANPTTRLEIIFAIIDTDVAKVFLDRLNSQNASARPTPGHGE